MIIQEFVEIKISPSNFSYWKNKGYEVGKTGGRAGKNTTNNNLIVKVSDLASGSNVDIKCKCNKCNQEYIQRYCRNTDVCYTCRKIEQMQGNKLGTAGKGKPQPWMMGENNPRFNPNRKPLLQFTSKVHWLTKKTYEEHKATINPNDHPRGRCGVPGAYQLDHIVSIKEAFERGWTPELTADVSNLQMLSWEANRQKWT